MGLTVVAALALARVAGEERLFLARRAPGLRDGGLWELPGGKVEPGESPEAALLREIQEELQVGARITGPAQAYELPLGGAPCAFLVLPLTFLEEPRLFSAHDSWGYFTRAEAQGLALAPLDGPAIQAWLDGGDNTQL